MSQLSLLSDPSPPNHDGIVIHCGDVSLVLAERWAKLVTADPPWQYSNTGTPHRGFNGCAKGQYECPTMESIVAVLDSAYDCVVDDGYLFCWATWPTLVEFIVAAQSMRWRYLTGGSWHKTGGLGIGFHVRGDSEPFLIFSVSVDSEPFLIFGKGAPRPNERTLSNGYESRRTQHSEKPVEYLCRVMECLTAPGDLVLSLYSGMCPEARAAKATGRRLIGAELDPIRHAKAVGKLAGFRG